MVESSNCQTKVSRSKDPDPERIVGVEGPPGRPTFPETRTFEFELKGDFRYRTLLSGLLSADKEQGSKVRFPYEDPRDRVEDQKENHHSRSLFFE